MKIHTKYFVVGNLNLCRVPKNIMIKKKIGIV